MKVLITLVLLVCISMSVAISCDECQCQCDSSLTSALHYGDSNKTCQSGENWCYVKDGDQSTCTDKITSENFPGRYYSEDACNTPKEDSNECKNCIPSTELVIVDHLTLSKLNATIKEYEGLDYNQVELLGSWWKCFKCIASVGKALYRCKKTPTMSCVIKVLKEIGSSKCIKCICWVMKYMHWGYCNPQEYDADINAISEEGQICGGVNNIGTNGAYKSFNDASLARDGHVTGLHVCRGIFDEENIVSGIRVRYLNNSTVTHGECESDDQIPSHQNHGVVVTLVSGRSGNLINSMEFTTIPYIIYEPPKEYTNDKHGGFFQFYNPNCILKYFGGQVTNGILVGLQFVWTDKPQSGGSPGLVIY